MDNQQFDIPDSKQPGDAPSPLSPAPPAPMHLTLPLALVCLGVGILAGLALLESRWLATVPWSRAVVIQSGPMPSWEGAIPIATREVDAPEIHLPPAWKELEDGLSDELELLRQASLAYATAIELPDATWTSLLQSGRPPAPNTNEAVAGSMCKQKQFSIDGKRFDVVGTLKSGIPGLQFRYLCRNDARESGLFESDAVAGWIAPDGIPEAERSSAEESDEAIHFVMPLAPIPRSWAILALFALGLIVYGGAAAQIRILHRITHSVPWVGWLMQPAIEHKWLFRACHIACYGTYFAASAVAIFAPGLNRNAMLWVTEMFTRGELKHIGSAYFAGNIFAATWTTFNNNFTVQTLEFAILPSLLIPFLGLIKTMFSLGVAGFVLAPIWCEQNARLTFHSITLSLEAEPYVLAAFAICVYAVYVARTVLKGPEWFVRAICVVSSGTAVTAVMLLIAAFYEAVTLIVLS